LTFAMNGLNRKSKDRESSLKNRNNWQAT